MTRKKKTTLWLIVLCGWLIAATHDSAALRLYSAADECARGVTALDTLAWLAGSWECRTASQVRETHWSQPAGGTLLGFGRTLAHGQTAEFEFARLHAERDGLWLTLQTAGQPSATLRLVELDGATVVFEQPRQAFPRRITYRQEAGGSLLVRLEGPRHGQPHSQQFVFNRSQSE